jgi:membrane fusion protein, multidrug efflux system
MNFKNLSLTPYSLLIILLVAACAHPSKLETDKAKLTALEKQESELKDKIEKLQDTVTAEGGKVVKTIRVQVQDVTRQKFRHYVEVQATVYGQDNINVSSEMPGVVKIIRVTEGDTVSKGQILAELDDAVLEQNILEVQTSLELAKTLYEKQKGLWEQKIGTEVQFLSSKSNFDSQQKRLSALQQQDDMMKIVSPIKGTVDAVNIKTGESVAPGMPTIKVVNAELLKVKGNVAEAYISDIHTGDSLLVSFPDLKDTSKPGVSQSLEVAATASYVSKAIDEVNRTFTVEVKLSHSPNYHPNMIAMMKIIDYKNPSAVVIPINIVQSDPTGSFVFIAVNQNGTMIAKKQPVTVKTGMVYNGMAEISDGLNAGDKLITIGYEDLNNGDAINTN